MGTPEEIYEHPADSFVFRFMGIANFLPAIMKEGKAVAEGTNVCIGPAPDQSSETVAGLRPMDIELVNAETPIRGIVKRVALLVPIIDYRVNLGDHELRIQQETQESLNNNRIYAEGDTCFLRFHNLKWFDSQSLGEEV